MTVKIVTFKTTRYLNGRNTDGSPKNEVIDVKIQHGTFEYYNWLKNAKNTGLNKIEILNVKEKNGFEYKEIEIPQEVKEDLKKALTVEPSLTPEQKKIAELEAAIEELRNARNEPAKKEKAGNDIDLTEARQRYMDIVGKKGHHSWDVATIEEKINEFQAQ